MLSHMLKDIKIARQNIQILQKKAAMAHGAMEKYSITSESYAFKILLVSRYRNVFGNLIFR